MKRFKINETVYFTTNEYLFGNDDLLEEGKITSISMDLSGYKYSIIAKDNRTYWRVDGHIVSKAEYRDKQLKKLTE